MLNLIKQLEYQPSNSRLIVNIYYVAHNLEDYTFFGLMEI